MAGCFSLVSRQNARGLEVALVVSRSAMRSAWWHGPAGRSAHSRVHWEPNRQETLVLRVCWGGGTWLLWPWVCSLINTLSAMTSDAPVGCERLWGREP